MGTEVEWETTVDFHGNGHYNEEVKTTFRIVVDTYDRFSDTHEDSWGEEHEYTAYLKSIKFGEAVFNRDTVILMYGFQAVEQAEAYAEEKYRGEQ